jgi:WhiB family transcriptional regulator, redox-sensing transcriptional regulator
MSATASRASAAGQAGRPRSDPAWLTDGQLTARLMSPLARCAACGLNPEDWFPIATGADCARAESNHALALCAVCPVRAECLEFAMRHWSIGRHGIWGGLVETERAALRRAWRARTADPMGGG